MEISMSKELINEIISDNIKVVESIFSEVDSIMNISKRIIFTFEKCKRV